MSRHKFLKLAGAGITGAFVLGIMTSGKVMAEGTLSSEFEAAAEKHGVPNDLLLAVGYVNTHWQTPPTELGDYDPGDLHGMGGYGVMSLNNDPKANTLARASELTGIPEEDLKTERAANVMGGAAVISAIQGSTKPANLNGWYDAISDFGGSSLYANQVYETLQDGASQKISSGEKVTLESQPEAEPQQTITAQATGDYSRSTYYGAHYNNYSTDSRPPTIDRIVIHVTQGSWSSAINWFNDGRAFVSAHYTVRSSDGLIGQSVHEKDIAYHCRDWNYRSIGIEHEGYVSTSSYFTTAMYNSSARLTAYLCKKYRIPIDRTHIVGHNEVPGNDHTDPGPYWDWERYMSLVRSAAGTSISKSTYTQVVDNSTAGRFSASSEWISSSYSSQRYGANYRVLKKPGSASSNAKFKIKTPAKASYKVLARWPADSGYNNGTRFFIKTSGGWKGKVVNQRTNGGQWVSLGTYTLDAGDSYRVQVGSNSSGTGYIIADAVKIVRR